MSTLNSDKIMEIKELLSKVNVADICRRVDVKRRTVYAVLDRESSRHEELAKVIKEARREVRKQERMKKKLQSL